MFLIAFFVAAGMDSYGSFATIYLDVTISMFFAYIIHLLIYEENKCILAISMFSFMLVKDISLLFLILILVFLFISFIMYILTIKDKQSILKDYFFNFIYVFIPSAVSYILWYIYKVRAGVIYDQFALSNYSISEFIKIFTRDISGDKLTAANEFVKAAFNVNLSRSNIPLTYFNSLLLLIIITLVFLIISKVDKPIILRIIFFIISSYIIYYLFMLNMYVNVLTGIESTGLASYKRYISSFVVAMFLITFTYIYKYSNYKNIIVAVFALLSILFSTGFIVSQFNSQTSYFADHKSYERNIYKQLTKHIKNDEKCLIVEQVKHDSALIRNYYNTRKLTIDLYNIADVLDEGKLKSFYDNLINYKYISVIDYGEIEFSTFYQTVNKYIEENGLKDEYTLSALQANKIMPLK